MVMHAASLALQDDEPLRAYSHEIRTQSNPATGVVESLHVFTLHWPPTLPNQFVIAYDPVAKCTHLRNSADSVQNVTTLSEPPGAAAAGP